MPSNIYEVHSIERPNRLTLKRAVNYASSRKSGKNSSNTCVLHYEEKKKKKENRHKMIFADELPEEQLEAPTTRSIKTYSV